MDICIFDIVLSCLQVTKLCDLGPNDSVCSVQWTREGSYISIGTHLGQVQVTIYCDVCVCVCVYIYTCHVMLEFVRCYGCQINYKSPIYGSC